MRTSTVRLLILSGVMLVFGAVAPFAMIMQWVPSTLWLNGLSALATIFGMIFGVYGVFEYVHRGRSRR